ASDTLAWRYGNYDALRYEIHHLVVSPMQRALQTAWPINQATGIPTEVWWDICERGGVFQYHSGMPQGLPGMKRSEMRDRFPTFTLPTRISENGWWRGNQESREAGRLRANDVVTRIKAKAAGDWRNKRVMIVSHAGFMDALVKGIVSYLNPQTDSENIYFFYNSSITRLDFLDHGKIGIRFINRIPHLPHDLVS
ncbi:MAG: histidine phosphatase family protein, partial [Chloroflexota bacterium]